MPCVNVRITRDGATREQKQEIVAEITATLQRVLGKRPEHTHVVIDEVEPEKRGFGRSADSGEPRAPARRTVNGAEHMPAVTRTAAEHYEVLLAEHYTWMSGDFDGRVVEARELLQLHDLRLRPHTAPLWALDLGAGPGFQSIALAELGYQVTAVDTSTKLLREIPTRRPELPIETVTGDMRDLQRLGPIERVRRQGGYDVAVCMGDTLTHLESLEEVDHLFAALYQVLRPDGVLVLSFRDLTVELVGLDRFIPVRGDPDRVMTCFLEYASEHVVVHDLLHVREGDGWTLHKSSYRKLRLSPPWVADRLTALGFEVSGASDTGRMWTVAAQRR